MNKFRPTRAREIRLQKKIKKICFRIKIVIVYGSDRILSDLPCAPFSPESGLGRRVTIRPVSTIAELCVDHPRVSSARVKQSNESVFEITV